MHSRHCDRLRSAVCCVHGDSSWEAPPFRRYKYPPHPGLFSHLFASCHTTKIVNAQELDMGLNLLGRSPPNITNYPTSDDDTVNTGPQTLVLMVRMIRQVVPSSLAATTRTSRVAMVLVPMIHTVAAPRHLAATAQTSHAIMVPVPPIPMAAVPSLLEIMVESRPTHTTRTSQVAMVLAPPIHTMPTSHATMVPVPPIPMASASLPEATAASHTRPMSLTSQVAMVPVPPIPMARASLLATVASRPTPMSRTSQVAMVPVLPIHMARASLLATVASRPTPTTRANRVATVPAPPIHTIATSHATMVPVPPIPMRGVPNLLAMVTRRPTPTRTSQVAMVLVPLIHTAAPRPQAITAQTSHANMVPARPAPMAIPIAMGLAAVAEIPRVNKVTATRKPVTSTEGWISFGTCGSTCR